MDDRQLVGSVQELTDLPESMHFDPPITGFSLDIPERYRPKQIWNTVFYCTFILFGIAILVSGYGFGSRSIGSFFRRRANDD